MNTKLFLMSLLITCASTANAQTKQTKIGCGVWEYDSSMISGNDRLFKRLISNEAIVDASNQATQGETLLKYKTPAGEKSMYIQISASKMKGAPGAYQLYIAHASMKSSDGNYADGGDNFMSLQLQGAKLNTPVFTLRDATTEKEKNDNHTYWLKCFIKP